MKLIIAFSLLNLSRLLLQNWAHKTEVFSHIFFHKNLNAAKGIPKIPYILLL
jgi:hypothetical protein